MTHSPTGTPEEYLLELYTNEFPQLEDMGEEESEQFVAKTKYPGVLLPLYMLDHSGVSLRTTPFNDPWDSAWVGYVVVTPESQRNMGTSDDRLMDVVKSELYELEQRINGRVYFVEVTHPDGEYEVCGGLYDQEKETPEAAMDRWLIERLGITEEALAGSEWRDPRYIIE